MRAADYTTECPKCGERFAAQMIINKAHGRGGTTATDDVGQRGRTAAAEMRKAKITRRVSLNSTRFNKNYKPLSTDTSTRNSTSPGEKFPLVVPYLPPRALKKELCKLLDERGASFICHPDFRPPLSAVVLESLLASDVARSARSHTLSRLVQSAPASRYDAPDEIHDAAAVGVAYANTITASDVVCQCFRHCPVAVHSRLVNTQCAV